MKCFRMLSGVGVLAIVGLVTASCGSDDGGVGTGGSSGSANSGTGGESGSGTGGAGTGGSGTGGAGTAGSGAGTAGSGAGTAGSGAGTAGSGAGGAGGGTGNATCAQAETLLKARAQEQSCADNSATIKAACESFYATSNCVSTWEAIFNCTSGLPASAWECNNSNHPDPVGCQPEKDAFDACLGN